MRKSAVTVPVDLAQLSRDELLTLVHQLGKQLSEQEQEIERLKRLVRGPLSSDSTETSMHVSAEPEPGSPDDLLAQLEKTYPEG